MIIPCLCFQIITANSFFLLYSIATILGLPISLNIFRFLSHCSQGTPTAPYHNLILVERATEVEVLFKVRFSRHGCDTQIFFEVRISWFGHKAVGSRRCRFRTKVVKKYCMNYISIALLMQ